MTRRLLESHDAGSLVAFGDDGPWTKAQLLSDVAAVRLALPDARAGDVLLCFRHDRYQFAVALLAVWEAGLTAVLPPDLRPETLSPLISSTRRVALLHDTQVSGHLRVDELLKGASPAALERAPAPNGIAVRVVTSGSAAERRTLDKTYDQLVGEAEIWATLLASPTPSKIVATVQPGHVYGLVFSVLYPWLTGGAFCSRTPTSPEGIRRAVQHHAATTLVSVPAHLRGLQPLDPDALGTLERVISSTAPLHDHEATPWVDSLGLRVTDVLGSTEAGTIAWRERPGDDAWKSLGEVAASSERASEVERTHSLEQEAWLLQQAEVRDAAILDVPGPSGATQRLALVASEDRIAGKLRQSMRERFGTRDAPVQLVAVHRLPRGPSGELWRRDALSLFGLDAAGTPLSQDLDFVGSPQARGEQSVQQVRVPENFALFQGHFDGYPTMAGVVQLLSLILPFLRRLRPGLGELKAMDGMKFTGRICPGDEVTLVARFDNAPRLEGAACALSIEKAGSVVTAGRLRFFGETSHEHPTAS